jgi:hypothetical protein
VRNLQGARIGARNARQSQQGRRGHGAERSAAGNSSAHLYPPPTVLTDFIDVLIGF